jgi:hypothetical protein
MTIEVLTGLAVSATALFAGGALYVSLVEHPARRMCGAPMGIAQFRTSYPRGAALQAPLALAGGLAGAAAWLAGAPAGWLGAGLLLVAAVPYTLALLMRTNRRLLEPALSLDGPEARRLLGRWGLLHFPRTLGSLLALAWMVLLLSHR